MGRLFLVVAGGLGAAGVILGAFGAHALRASLAPDLLEVWHTAVQYHMWHALALLGVGVLLLHQTHAPWLVVSGWAFIVGILIFSGSLYLLALTGLRTIGAVTPVGGLVLIAGWVMLAVTAARQS